MFKTKTSMVFIVSAVLVTSIIFSIVLVPSFSQSTLFSLTDKMRSSEGPTTVKIGGESTTRLDPDQATVIFNLATKTHPLNELAEQRNIEVNKFKDQLIESIGQENISISYGSIYFNIHGYGGTPDMSSVTTQIEIPVRITAEDIDEVSKIISDQGFWINNLQVQKVEKTTDSTKPTGSKVSVTSGSATPNCEIASQCYLPYEMIVNVGQSVTWTNDDSAAHTVTSGTPDGGPDGDFDSGLFVGGGTFTHSFNMVGTFDYFCLVHPWMTGIVTVLPDTDDKPVAEQKQPEFVHQVTLTAITVLPPDTIENSIIKYQEKQTQIVSSLSKYQIEQQSSRQGNVYFNPTFWGQGISSSVSTNNQIIIKVPASDVGKALDVAKDHNANIETFYLSYSSQLLDSSRQELTQKALENAKDRAMEIVGPMGLEIKGIKSIEVSTAPPINPYGSGPFTREGVLLRSPVIESTQANEILVSVITEFEVGRK